MSLSTSNFSLHQLEARFEMQCVENMDSGDGGGYYYDQQIDGCGGGGGAAYDYYGSSWGDLGGGEGYVGTYETSGDGSYAALDDGTYTDGTSGDFPGYDDGDGAMSPTELSTTEEGANGVRVRSYCVICRCRF